MTLSAGTQLDRYTIEAFLGAGAMGKVYRAFDARLERAVAIKVLEPASMGDSVSMGDPERVPQTPPANTGGSGTGEAEVVASALREARAAAAILHPNATAIFDADRIGDTSFIVMELVPGKSLRRIIGDASVHLRTRIRWLVDVAGALAAAHHAGVIHRDVKPENVIVRNDGLVKVLDFGIARLPRSPTAAFATLTSGGSLLGTPAYMAPEQIRCEEVDGRADQFAWGVLAYELLSGRLPWGAAPDPIALLAAVLTGEPAPLATVAPEVNAEIAAAVHRALAKSPRNRFPSMQEAAAALSPFAGARRHLRRQTGGDGQPPSSEPFSSGPAAIELGFPDRITPFSGTDAVSPFATSLPPGPPPSAPPPPPSMPTLTSGRVGVTGEVLPVLRAPDFGAPVDVDAHLALLPPDATCKGFFFLELLRLGTPSAPAAQLFELAGLPEHRYVGFRDYPAAEYARLAVAVGLTAHRAVPLGEGLRRIGHTAFAASLGSLVGKTLFGVHGRDLEPLLFSAPRAYRLFLNFGELTVEKTGRDTYRCQAHAFPAFLETLQVGVLEGVLRHCGAHGRIQILVEALDRATLDLSLDQG